MLRTMGASKRNNMDKPESYLVYQTLQDMNLSKLVAQDVPLFLSIRRSVPEHVGPPKAEYPDMEAALLEECEKDKISMKGPRGQKALGAAGSARSFNSMKRRRCGTALCWLGPPVASGLYYFLLAEESTA